MNADKVDSRENNRNLKQEGIFNLAQSEDFHTVLFRRGRKIEASYFV